jgi:hypothetical protein
MLKPFRYVLDKFFSTRIEVRAKRLIKNNKSLRSYLEYYKSRSPSTGCSYADYLAIYNYVKKHKPKEVLECGTGFSTLVIAQALKENEEEYGIRGHLVSMEESEKYYGAALKSLPPDLKNDSRLEIVLSPVIEDSHGFFHGVLYKEIPPRKYDFVFVDGPSPTAGFTAARAINLDFVKLVSESDHYIGALIDSRKCTCLMYSLLFPNKFSYDYLRDIGIVTPVNKYDLADDVSFAKWAAESSLFRSPSVVELIRGEY